MHEITIANKIIQEIKKQGARKSIKLEVGELSNIGKDELEETLNKLTKLEIKVINKKSKIKCNCGYIGKARIIEKEHDYCIFNCPKCGNKPEVLEGGEIKIIGVN